MACDSCGKNLREIWVELLKNIALAYDYNLKIFENNISKITLNIKEAIQNKLEKSIDELSTDVSL